MASSSSSSSETDEPTIFAVQVNRTDLHQQSHAPPPTQPETQPSQPQQAQPGRRSKLRSAFRRDAQTSIVDPGHSTETSKWEALATKHQQLTAIHGRQQQLFKDFAKLSRAMSKVSELLASISARAGALREVTNAAYPGLYPLLSATESFFLSISRRQQELEFTLSQASAPLKTADIEIHTLDKALKKRDGRLTSHTTTMRDIEHTQVTSILEHLPRIIQSVQTFNDDLATSFKQNANLAACCEASARAFALLQSGSVTPSSFHLFPNLKKASLRPSWPQQAVVQLSNSKHQQATRRLQTETVAFLAPAAPVSSSLSITYSRSVSIAGSPPYGSDSKPRSSLQAAVEVSSSSSSQQQSPAFLLSQSQPAPKAQVHSHRAQSPPPVLVQPKPQSSALASLVAQRSKSPPLSSSTDIISASLPATISPFLGSTREFPPAPPPPSTPSEPSTVSPPESRSTSPDNRSPSPDQTTARVRSQSSLPHTSAHSSTTSTTIPISSSTSIGGTSSFSSSSTSSSSLFSLSLSSPSPPSLLSPQRLPTPSEQAEPATPAFELQPRGPSAVEPVDLPPPTMNQQLELRSPTPPITFIPIRTRSPAPQTLSQSLSPIPSPGGALSRIQALISTPIVLPEPVVVKHRIIEVKPSASAFPLEPFIDARSGDGILYSSDEFEEDQDEFSDNAKNDSDDDEGQAADSPSSGNCSTGDEQEQAADLSRPSLVFPGRPKGFLEFSMELDRHKQVQSYQAQGHQSQSQQDTVPQPSQAPPITSSSKSFSLGRLTKSLLTGEIITQSFGEPQRQNSSSPPLPTSSSSTTTPSSSFTSHSPAGVQRLLASQKPEPAGTNDDEIAAVVNLPDEKDLKFASKDGKLFVRAASFERLIERLTHPSLSDPTFRKAFLNTAPLIATSDDLLTALINRFELTVHQADSSLHLIRLRVLGALQAWFGLSGYMLEDEALVQRIQGFLSTLGESPHLSSSFLPQALQIKHLIIRKIQKRQTQQRKMRTLRKAIQNGERPVFSLLNTEFDVMEAAEILTLIESEFYCNIDSIELLLYIKSNNKEVDSPNIFALIDLFNRFSGWLSSEIVVLPRIEDRVRAIEKAINLASALFSLNNLNATVGVVSALANSSVRRLKRTWEQVSPELSAKLAELEEIFSPDFAYRAFRDYLRNSAPPCIPYLGIFLTDMTFIQEGNPSFAESLINFSKYFKIFQLLQQLQNHQEPYVDLQKKFRETDQLLPIERYLRTLPRVEESFLYERSTLTEPKDWEAATEKWFQVEARLLERIRQLESKAEGNPRLSAP